jgi:ketosteroid isomerase-like protein
VPDDQYVDLAQRLEALDFGSDEFLAALADGVEFIALGDPDLLPWAGTFRGREGILEWRGRLVGALKYDAWEPLLWVGAGDLVLEVAHARGHARETGRSYESDIARVWTFREGKVIRLMTYYDTLGYALAIGAVRA